LPRFGIPTTAPGAETKPVLSQKVLFVKARERFVLTGHRRIEERSRVSLSVIGNNDSGKREYVDGAKRRQPAIRVGEDNPPFARNLVFKVVHCNLTEHVPRRCDWKSTGSGNGKSTSEIVACAIMKRQPRAAGTVHCHPALQHWGCGARVAPPDLPIPEYRSLFLPWGNSLIALRQTSRRGGALVAISWTKHNTFSWPNHGVVSGAINNREDAYFFKMEISRHIADRYWSLRKLGEDVNTSDPGKASGTC